SPSARPRIPVQKRARSRAQAVASAWMPVTGCVRSPAWGILLTGRASSAGEPDRGAQADRLIRLRGGVTTAFTCRAGCKERGVSKSRNAGPVKCNAWLSRIRSGLQIVLIDNAVLVKQGELAPRRPESYALREFVFT